MASRGPVAVVVDERAEAALPLGADGRPVRNSALREPPPDEKDHYRFDHPAAAHVRIEDADAGECALMTRKQIAIVGFATSSRGVVPVNDPAWEVWGLNQLYRHIPRADRWFDIHETWNAALVPGTEPGEARSYEGWVRDCGIPFYMVKREADKPTTLTYPVDRLIAHHGADYFTSTIAYMLALAVYEIDRAVDARLAASGGVPSRQALQALYEEYAIGLFGIDLIVGEEYDWQKACAEYWIGMASARGIRVLIPPTSALCRHLFRYGYQSDVTTLLPAAEVARHGSDLRAKRDEMLKQLLTLEGALAVDEYWEQVLTLRARGGATEAAVEAFMAKAGLRKQVG